jgi:hypothetical protein
MAMMDTPITKLLRIILGIALVAALVIYVIKP